jgi:4-carboxymuconolactone decarboxylase
MAESELYRKGMAVRRELFGDDYMRRIDREVFDDPLTKKFLDLITEIGFGAVMARPGLDLKTRTLISVVSDVSRGHEAELGLHLRMARRQGWNEEELVEVLLQLIVFVGAPLVRDAMLMAKKVFGEIRSEQAASNERDK